jgi:hypothetical protein
VLQVYKLTEEKALIYEAAGPLEVKNSNALANGEVAAVCQKQSRVLILYLY